MWFLYVVGVVIIISIIQWLINKRREKIREQVAHDLFDKSDTETILENYKNKLSAILITTPREIPKRISSWELARLPKYAAKIAGSDCPKCESGYLKVIYTYNGYGRLPSVFSCSSKECNYIIGLKQAKVEYEKNNINSFAKDFNQVYP